MWGILTDSSHCFKLPAYACHPGRHEAKYPPFDILVDVQQPGCMLSVTSISLPAHKDITVWGTYLSYMLVSEPGYDYENEAQQFIAEIECLPTSMRPKGQLYHVERTIAEASGGLKSGKPLDFTHKEGVWKGYKQIGIVTADEHVIFSF